MAQLLGLDLGTTGAKTLVIDDRGEVLATHTEGYPLYQPEQGWSEQNPEEWWKATLKALKSVLAKGEVDKSSIRGIGLSGQMHGSVFLDEENRVIRNPILWNDTRTSEQCREIEDTIGEDKLLNLVGNPALEGFTAPKVLWLKEKEPENYEKLETLLLPKDYIVYRLTGRLVTEKSDAAGTLLYDVRNQEWSEEICEALDIDPEILPEVLDSEDVVANVKPGIANEIGLPSDLKVVAGGADNACSAVGNGVTEEGLFLVSIGSSGVVLAHSASMETNDENRIHYFNHSVSGKWYLMGVMLSAGLSLRWFRDNFARLETQTGDLTGTNPYEFLNSEAKQVPAGSEGLVFLPYLSGERTPHQNAKARGVFFGISGTHDKRHFVRSILEGVTFGLQDSLELIKDMGIEPTQIRVTGGGAQSALWRKIQADIFGQEVVATKVDEGPAYGAALLAGVGSGTYKSINNAVDRCVTISSYDQPDSKNQKVYSELYSIYRSLYTSLENDYEKLSDYSRGRRQISG
ncbi:xylulokinase [Candidatus Bipolaricaulota bacterium]|nr:xylulokinase [Candidatus Bipolaricaulota bacterium]